MQKKGLLFLYITLVSFNIFADGNDKAFSLKLDTLKCYNELYYHSIKIPTAIKIWPTSELEVDSILYELTLQDKGDDMSCKELPLKINLLVKKNKSLMQIVLKGEANNIMDNIILSYDVDSANVIDKKTLIKRVEMSLPFCLNDTIQSKHVDLYLIPYNDRVDFKDKRIQKLPLLISMGKYRKTNLAGYSLYFTKNDYMKSDLEATEIYVSKDGIYHKDKYVDMNGVKIDNKDVYHLGDTLCLNNCFYKLCNITDDWDSLQIIKIANVQQTERLLSDTILEKIIPYFNEGQDLMLIDFWGTWCVPCIKGLPEMQKLYRKVQDKCGFISICFDDFNNLEKAREILDNYNIKWGQIFEERKYGIKTITRKLKIDTFPSIIIINRKGKILFRGKGQLGFEEIKKLLLNE